MTILGQTTGKVVSMLIMFIPGGKDRFTPSRAGIR